MRHAKTTRIITVLMLMVLLGGESKIAVGTGDPRDPETKILIEWAKSMFDRAGLEFPEVSFQFHDDLTVRDGHVGVFYPDTDLLVMCRLDMRTALHEPAHAWIDQNLSDDERMAFVEHRGLETWGSHDMEWHLRGTEHAAETLAWGLMDTTGWCHGLREGIDGKKLTYRLLSIPDSGPDQLIASYVLLTRLTPINRIQDDPRLQAPLG